MKIDTKQIDKFLAERTFTKLKLPKYVRFMMWEWEEFKKDLKSQQIKEDKK